MHILNLITGLASGCALFWCWMAHFILTDNLSRYAIAMQFWNHWEPSSKRQLVYILSLVQSGFFFAFLILSCTHISLYTYPRYISIITLHGWMAYVFFISSIFHLWNCTSVQPRTWFNIFRSCSSVCFYSTWPASSPKFNHLYVYILYVLLIIIQYLFSHLGIVMDNWCTPEWVGMIHTTFTLVVSTSG